MKVKQIVRNYLSDYKFNSLLLRNLLLLLSLMLIPLSGAGLIAYYSYKNMQTRERENISEKLADDIYSSIEEILRESKTQLMYIGMNSNVELYMYDEELNQFNYKIKTIQEMIKMPVLAKDYVDSVWVYSVAGNRVITQEGVAIYDDFSGHDRIAACLEQENERMGMLLTAQEGAKPQLTVFQKVKYGKKLNGVVLQNMGVWALLEELNVPQNAELYVTDGKVVLLAADRELLGKTVEEIRNYDKVVQNGTYLDSTISITSRVAPNYDLEVITKMDMSNYNDQLGRIRGLIFLFLGVMTVITTVLSVVVSFRLFLPIEKIMDSLQEYHSILMGEEELFQNRNELEYILDSIQKTVKAKKNVEMELAERVRLLKKAQAVALQSQINPHFLNNTLETINWMAIGLLDGKNEISHMVGALSKMLRMSMENSDTVVAVRTETEHCKYYVEIQKSRYEDKFDVRWEIPEEVMDCQVIRIVLQPLVENAIYHGIKPMSGKGEILIKGRIEKESVFLTVRDNGIGMSESRLMELRESLRSDSIRESRHIGISNVNQRLKLYYGEEYGLEVDSIEGRGTSVTMRIPQIPAAENPNSKM